MCWLVVPDCAATKLVEGTSASAPVFAAVVSRLNQAQFAKTGKPLGFLNPLRKLDRAPPCASNQFDASCPLIVAWVMVVVVACSVQDAGGGAGNLHRHHRRRQQGSNDSDSVLLLGWELTASVVVQCTEFKCDGTCEGFVATPGWDPGTACQCSLSSLFTLLPHRCWCVACSGCSDGSGVSELRCDAEICDVVAVTPLSSCRCLDSQVFRAVPSLFAAAGLYVLVGRQLNAFMRLAFRDAIRVRLHVGDHNPAISF